MTNIEKVNHLPHYALFHLLCNEKSKFPRVTPQALAAAMSSQFGVELEPHNVIDIFSEVVAPSMGQMCRQLRKYGLPASQVAMLLETGEANVRYHWSRENPEKADRYVNAVIIGLQAQQANNLSQFGKIVAEQHVPGLEEM